MTRVGPFELVHRVHLGGWSEVWQAQVSEPPDRAAALEILGALPPVGGWVALKRMLPTADLDADVVEMFEDEARVAAKLVHPAICPVLALGREAGSPYLITEFVFGENLRSLLDRAAALGDPVPFDVVCLVGQAICRGLERAHSVVAPPWAEQGFVHRDISPHNVLIGYGGAIKLIDFGIAKGVGQSRRTQVGVLKGKLGYMAPEQLVQAALDGRADLFALGVVLWEMVAGTRLFGGGRPVEVMDKVASMPAPSLVSVRPHTPPALERAIERALAKPRAERWESATALEQALAVATSPGATADPEAVVRAWVERLVPAGERAMAPGTEASRLAAYVKSAEGRGEETTDRTAPFESTRAFASAEDSRAHALLRELLRNRRPGADELPGAPPVAEEGPGGARAAPAAIPALPLPPQRARLSQRRGAVWPEVFAAALLGLAAWLLAWGRVHF